MDFQLENWFLMIPMIYIYIYFNHYKTFEDAKAKWEERKQRIIWDKIYVIYQFNDRECDVKLLEQFDKLPFKNKIALIHRDIPEINIKNFYKFNCVSENDPLTKVFEYDGLSGKRYFEEFDYISFLNN